MNKEIELNDENLEVIELVDEDGNTVEFKLIGTVACNDNEYVFVMNEEDPDTYFIFRMTHEGEEVFFDMVEDEEELDAVMQEIDRIEEEEDES